MCEFFNAPRASRAQPEARAGRKRRREEKHMFLAHTFYKTEGQSGGITKNIPPRPSPTRTRGNRTPRRSATRFRRRPRSHSDFFNRNSTSGARSLVFDAVRRPRAKHREVRKRGFSKGASPSCYGGAHATRRTRLFEKAPRARGPAVPTFRFPFVTPSLPPYLFYVSFSQRFTKIMQREKC